LVSLAMMRSTRPSATRLDSPRRSRKVTFCTAPMELIANAAEEPLTMSGCTSPIGELVRFTG